MAAAEYYNPGMPQGTPGGPVQGQNLRPPTQPPPPMQNPSSPSLPYPLSDAPPPYSAFADQQRPQSQPPPQQRPPQPNYQNGGGYQPYHPQPQQNGDTHQYPPEKLPQRPSLQQNTYRPSDYTSQHPPPPPPQAQQQQQPQQYQQSNGFSRPGLSQLNYPGKEVRFNTQTQRPSSQPAPGYPTASPERQQRYRSPSRSRSRSRSRERRRRHHSHRPAGMREQPEQKKKGSSASTFLGAGGGALIGDMIFPGLGTLGGAILGGVGGHEYSKDKGRRHAGSGAGQRSYSHGDYYEDDYKRGRR